MKPLEPPCKGEAKAFLPRRVLSQHGSRIVRFGLVGVSGVLVNYALLYLFVGLGNLNLIAAAALATEAAILSNFTLNNLWTFGRVRPKTTLMRRALQYNFFCFGGLVISVTVLTALTYLLNVHYLAANVFAIGSTTLWNYTTSHCWTWAPKSLTEDSKAAIKGRGLK